MTSAGADHQYLLAEAERAADEWLAEFPSDARRLYGKALRSWLAHCAEYSVDPFAGDELELFLAAAGNTCAAIAIDAQRAAVGAFHEHVGSTAGSDLEVQAQRLDQVLELAGQDQADALAHRFVECLPTAAAQRAHGRVLGEWYAFCAALRISPLAAPIPLLEVYETWLSDRGRQPAAVAHRLAAVGAFYSWCFAGAGSRS